MSRFVRPFELRRSAWGVTPTFCRGLSVRPASDLEVGARRARAEGSPCERRRGRSSGPACLTLSVLLHAAVFALWPGGLTTRGERPDVDRRGARSELRLVTISRPAIPAPSPAAARRSLRGGSPRAPVVVDQAFAVRATALPVRATALAASPLDLTPAVAPAATRVGMRGGSAPRGVAATGSEVAGEGSAPDVGAHLTPPRARSILPSWKPPRSVYGLAVVARVHTDAAGRATGPVELLPPTPSTRTNREIIERVRSLAYWPAIRDGAPVAAWAEITLVFCYAGVTATSALERVMLPRDLCGRDG